MNFEGFFGDFCSEPQRNFEVDTEYYDLLNLKKDCSQDEIRTSFRKLARKWHPDKYKGDDTKFKEIQNAYSVLSDPEKRETYDKYGKKAVEEGGSSGHGVNLSDLFTKGRSSGRTAKGRNMSTTLKVSLEDIYTGADKKLRLKKDVICKKCNGVGSKSGQSTTCPQCNGAGRVVSIQRLGPSFVQQVQKTCNLCKGTGESIRDKDRCSSCSGKKTVEESKILNVFIEPGMDHGFVIPFHGEADQAPNMHPGDVLVKVEQKEHAVFKRDAMNLFMQKHISLVDALCGGFFTIKHLDKRILGVEFGKDKRVIQPHSVKCIEGEGMPQHRSPFNKGSLFIEFIVDFPETNTFSKEQNQALASILPAPLVDKMKDVREIYEEVRLSDISLEEVKRKQKTSHRPQSEAYHEDEDDVHQEHNGVNACQTQ